MKMVLNDICTIFISSKLKLEYKSHVSNLTKGIKNPKMKYIDYGIILMKKNILKKNTKKFQLSIFLKYLSENKQITYMVTKKNFFEIGSLYGYRQTINNFHKITKELNEI